MVTQLPLQRGTSPPNFRPMSVVAKRLDGLRCQSLGMEVGLGPGDFVLDGDRAQLPPEKKGTAPANFWPMSIVAKRLDGRRRHLIRK